MSIEEKTRLFLAFDSMITRRIKGNANDYANMLGIPRSTFFRLLDHLRDKLSAPIKYSAENRRYEYEREGKLYFGFLATGEGNLSDKDLKKINGGHISYMAHWYGYENILSIFLPVSTGETQRIYV